jgi:uncharacterized protein (TIGR02680 family)
MGERWVLHRAGIVNVYQYADEILTFAGGRLLLRGLNGSGKSTAMNMLLPFLLEGDPRRIDAAGEQTGVLRSWMLDGRDDAQPIGYLWLEMARGSETLAFGCGIKANRSTDNVTTWWWITTRQPGVDLHLVDGRHPKSSEALRAALDPDPVYRQEERARYRRDLRQRLYGGAGLDQHLRLLHIVRNPRVGDRIDIELPGHLHDALPELSEEALAEAAQPLDDLDEHRHNVHELQQTSATLAAMGEVYRDYARGEAHRVAGRLRDRAATAESARRRAATARREAAEAAQRLARTTARAEHLDHDRGRLETELRSLRDAPAYREGLQLDDLRRSVQALAEAIGRAADARDRAAADTQSQRNQVDVSRLHAEGDHDELAREAADLGALVVPAGLPLGVPDLPTLQLVDIDGSGGEVPAAVPDPGRTARHLEALRAAVQHRHGDVGDVRADLAVVDAAEQAVAKAASALGVARADHERREGELLLRTAELGAEQESWRAALVSWASAADDERTRDGLPAVTWLGEGISVIAERTHVAAVALQAVEELIDARTTATAQARAERGRADTEVRRCAERCRELDEATEPAPSALAWQREGRGPVLAELVDFRPEVEAEERARLEAALEASGLLTAEVGGDGTLQVGDLVVGGAPADRHLGTLLQPVAPPHGGPERSAVEAALAAISVDADLINDGGSASVVTSDGRFRLGALRGRHAKAEAEHVGVTARRRRLERDRAAARAELAAAEATLAGARDALASAEQAQTSARELRGALPTTTRLDAAVVALHQAESDLARDAERVAARAEEHRRREETHAEAIDKCRRTAANHGLPADRAALASVERRLHEARGGTHRVGTALKAWVRSVEGWAGAADRWRSAVEKQARAEAELRRSTAEHGPVAARLATLEDAFGADYDEIVGAVSRTEAELGAAERALADTRQEQLDATAAETSARKEAETAEAQRDAELRRCADDLAEARADLQVPGLLVAATDEAEAVGTPVEATPAGLRALVAAIEASVPQARRGVSADTVRASLRQRRDSLGASYDAEDRQAEGRPLAVEINGPNGRLPLVRAISEVEARLAELSALLSTEQDQALRQLLEGMVATEVAEKMHEADDLVRRMNTRLDTITTSHGIGVALRWRRCDDLDAGLGAMIDLMAILPQLRSEDQKDRLRAALSERLVDARRLHPQVPYRALIGEVLDYRSWFRTTLLLRRPGRDPERLTRRTKLSEGEKKVVSYLPLFAAVAASCDALAEHDPSAPRFVLLDDAFAKVSEDNHAKLFGLLVDLDLDFIATSERLWGTHATVPELAITEVVRDASLGAIVLERSRWDGEVLA